MNLEVLKAVDEEADWYAKVRRRRLGRIRGRRHVVKC